MGPAGRRRRSSLGIHESQSRLWENHVGGSHVVLEEVAAARCRSFPASRRAQPEQVAGASAQVEPSFIRVEADEVTYDLHIILRFELERAMIEGDLAVADVPGAWNEKFEQLLGLERARTTGAAVCRMCIGVSASSGISRPTRSET